MLQLHNQTPFKATMVVLPDRAGIDTLYVVVKATVNLRPSLSLAAVQVPPTLADEYYDDPATSSLRYATEIHIGKIGTDVLLTGSAWARDGRPVPSMTVGIKVADRQKAIIVTGDRVWQDGAPSSPKPFESIPLVWERAFGGVHRRGEEMVGEDRNPVGCGFAGGRSTGDMQGLPVPNLEDPASPVQRVGDAATPACMAPIAASWLPRRRYAGTYDEQWERSRAPYLPDDFDQRFFQSAVPELAFTRYLRAGEQVHVAGVMPDGPILFTIPDAQLSVAVTVAGTIEQPDVNLETLLIEPDENRACFTWRAAMPCNRQALKIQKVLVTRAGASRS